MKGIDWTEIQSRIEAVSSALIKGFERGPEEKRGIFRQRAVELAKEVATLGAEEHIDVVEFLLAHERYGIETSYILEVYPLKELTHVPCTPPFILGVINLRGRIFSVVDLKKFFGLPDRGLGDLNKVIVLKSGAMEFGVLADVIIGVRPVPLAVLQPSVHTFVGVREEYLKGITADRMVILDACRILSDKTLIVNEEVEI
jgi:purine-binding chemotaxis protein CheW